MSPGDATHQKRDFHEASSSRDSSAGGENDQGKRRKTNASGLGRGVANLTPQQLEKKRANDREAQRAIRERTKNQIESLEAKIRELTSQQPYQELQNALRQKEVVELENADIKKRLNSVLALIQPILGQHGLEVSQYASPVQTSTPNSATSPAPPVIPVWQNMGASIMQPDPRAYPSTQRAQMQQLVKQRQDMAHNLDMGSDRLGLDFLLDGSQRINKIPNDIDGTLETTNYQQMPRSTDRPGSVDHRSNPMGSHSSYNPGASAFEIIAHKTPFRNGPPTCPLDSLLLDFLHERQQQASAGVSTPKLVGPTYPSVSSLLNRNVDSHPLSKVFTDILSTFPDLSTLPEKVAVLYIMFLIMRWQISPTEENYDRLPDWVTPRPCQLFTPHPAWIDHLPFPKMRDRLVRDYNHRDYLFDNFFIPFTSTLSLNWPYEPTDTLLTIQGSEELVINPVFERHLRCLDNWTLGPAFANAFPGLSDTYRLKTDGDRR